MPDVVGPTTLAIDIGGTGIKLLRLDGAGAPLDRRVTVATPASLAPDEALALVTEAAAQAGALDRVSCGFPGVVRRGVVETAPHWPDAPWPGTDLAAALRAAFGVPARVVNDADLIGRGAARGHGVEMVLTFGTSLGTAVFIGGVLLPNLEFCHQPWRDGRTYGELVGRAALASLGEEAWSRRAHEMLAQLRRIWNFDRVWLGGGHAPRIADPLPPWAERFAPEEGLAGAVRLWEEVSP